MFSLIPKAYEVCLAHQVYKAVDGRRDKKIKKRKKEKKSFLPTTAFCSFNNRGLTLDHNNNLILTYSCNWFPECDFL